MAGEVAGRHQHGVREATENAENGLGQVGGKADFQRAILFSADHNNPLVFVVALVGKDLQRHDSSGTGI